MDVIIEVLDTKYYDVVRSYSVNNVVISNRYISKMVTQNGEKESVFDFYNDILVYDEGAKERYTSKELYIKRAGRFFESIPGPATADVLIRSVYEAGGESIFAAGLYPRRSRVASIFWRSAAYPC